MKIGQDSGFRTVTIKLETAEDLDQMRRAMNRAKRADNGCVEVTVFAERVLSTLVRGIDEGTKQESEQC